MHFIAAGKKAFALASGACEAEFQQSQQQKSIIGVYKLVEVERVDNACPLPKKMCSRFLVGICFKKERVSWQIVNCPTLN